MSDLWDDVPDVEDYSTPGPLHYPGMTHAEYFRKLRAELAEQHEQQEEDESGYEVTITQEAEEFDDPCSPLAGYVKIAVNAGWTLAQLGHSRAFAKGKPFKTGANEGKSRPDQEIEQQWLYAVRGGDRLAVSYCLINGQVRGNSTVRSLNGGRLPDREMKARMKDTA